MIGIIDYGMGNLFSVKKALERLDVPYTLSDKPEELSDADGFILPGVGAFKDAMSLLRESGLEAFVHQIVADQKPLLGICLGMQLLFDESEEFKLTKGLGLLKGRAVHINSQDEDGLRLKVPHMGWNRLTFHRENELLREVNEGYCYFVHSFYITEAEEDTLLATADYGVPVPAVVGKGNVFGTQFHPEKSSEVGMAILSQFTKIAAEQKVKK
ncbi:imidazole glycerol phosphate synthase subunit HisH [Bacillus gobiensis]|uniref:imidazole glycerol phosphate synthase subunit HisH n=1 Tax=Bacillus gobiensis TaxID=1441095 RepID=UPI003D25C592